MTNEPGRRPRLNEHTRAFWLPVIGVIAIMLLALLFQDQGDKVMLPALTAIITLTASSAGHAAGAAGRRDGGEGPSNR